MKHHTSILFFTLTIFVVVLTSSCLRTSIPAPEETSTITAKLNPSALPSPTSTISPTPAPTPTPEPAITASDWAIDQETGRFDPEMMSPLVGSINHVNSKYIDLIYNGLKIALATTVDLTQLEDLERFKREQVDRINQQEELKKKLNLIISKNNPRQLTAVVGGDQITQVVFKYGDVIQRYHVDNEGNLKAFTKEEEPPLMPPLSSPDSHFIRTDTGEQVMLRGGHIVNTVFAPNLVDVAAIEGILQGLSVIGANWVVFQWNSGFLEGPESSTYKAKLLKVLRLAKQNYGFWVQIDLHSRGLEDLNDPYRTEQIYRLDSQVIEDWRKLLGDPETAFWIGKTVDIFTIVSEPNNPPNEPQTSFFDPLLLQACDAIRSGLNNPNAICNLSAGRWGWAADADELLDIPRPESFRETTINVHPYRLGIGEDIRSDIRDYAQNLQSNGWNVSVGEFGWRDVAMNPEYIEDALKFFEENKISYAWFGTAGGYNTDYLNNPKAQIDEVGDVYVERNGERTYIDIVDIDIGDASSLFIDYSGQVLSPTGKFLKDFWSRYKDE